MPEKNIDLSERKRMPDQECKNHEVGEVLECDKCDGQCNGGHCLTKGSWL